jgi:NitT/TauT family transport system substrate-binding protein
MRSPTFAFAFLFSFLCCHYADAQTKQIVTYAYTGDASYAPFLYALKSGKVSSPTVEVRIVEAAIPALIQAMGTKQYDLIENTVLGVPVALSRGLDGIIVGSGGIVRGGRYLMIKKDSPFQSALDLRGKVVGTNGLASTAVAHLRFVLAKKYGLNVALQNGSYQWVDLPLATLPAALSRDQVSAIFVYLAVSLKAVQSGEFRTIIDVPREYRELFDVAPLTSVIFSYRSVVAEKGPAIRETMALLKSSAEWAKSHPDQAYSVAVSKPHNLDPDDLKILARAWYEVNFALGPDERKMIETVWINGKELGLIENYPKLTDVIWE